MGDALSETSRSLEKAEAKISDLGLPLPSKPKLTEEEKLEGITDLEWPRNIADLSPYDLAEHMSWWSGWGGFARYHLARAISNFKAFQEELDIETKKRIYKSSGDYKTVTECKAAISQMPDMVKKAIRKTEAEALVEMLKALLEGYEGKYTVTSREISRRGMDYDENKERKENWNG